MKQKKLINLFSMVFILTFIFSILLYPTFSYAQSEITELNTLNEAKENTTDNAYVVIDAKTGEVVDEFTTDDLQVQTRSVTTNHTEPYKVPLRSQNEISTRSIIGGDERTEVSHPYNEVAYLQTSIGQGTATMVYRNLALTSGNLIFNGSVCSYAEVWPERIDGNAPYGSAYASQFVVSRSFYEDGNQAEDWCLIILDRNIGDQSGWQAIAYSDDYSYYANGERVNVTGYPSEKGIRQYTETGPVVQANQDYLYYDIDTTSGQGGSPVYDKNGYVIGVHKGSATLSGSTWNRCVNINKDRFQTIVSYMN